MDDLEKAIWELLRSKTSDPQGRIHMTEKTIYIALDRGLLIISDLDRMEPELTEGNYATFSGILKLAG